MKIKVLSCPLCSSPQHPLTTLCRKGSQVVTKVAKKATNLSCRSCCQKAREQTPRKMRGEPSFEEVVIY